MPGMARLATLRRDQFEDLGVERFWKVVVCRDQWLLSPWAEMRV